MHDFIRPLSSHGASRPAGSLGHATAPLRGILRSFGEDVAGTPCRSSPRLSNPGNRKTKIQNRK
ncbi:MAG: hypothetical protein ACOZE5_07015 [Verrucomicrobiota bacterium]